MLGKPLVDHYVYKIMNIYGKKITVGAVPRLNRLIVEKWAKHLI
jgi:hypothetical protein